MPENARGSGSNDARLGGEDVAGGASQRVDRDHGRGFDMTIWWEDRSLPMKILLGIGFGILGIGLLALLGWAVMALWNWLMPDIFGLKRLDYWKAWGLLVLCLILFKSWGSGSNNRRSDRKRRRHLRSYMKEDQPLAEEEQAGASGA